MAFKNVFALSYVLRMALKNVFALSYVLRMTLKNVFALSYVLRMALKKSLCLILRFEDGINISCGMFTTLNENINCSPKNRMYK
jgi:hypothetical protein